MNNHVRRMKAATIHSEAAKSAWRDWPPHPRYFLLRAGLIAMASSVATNAVAQSESAARATGEGLQEVMVTARKVTESLQDAPLSISAVGEAELQSTGLLNLQDLGHLVP